jgi:hypothetical protein
MKRKLVSGRHVTNNIHPTEISEISLEEAAAGAVKPFRTVLGEVFLANKLSAKDTHGLAASAHSEGAVSAAGMAKAGNSGLAVKNLARDIMRSLLKGISMPEVFYYPIPIWNSATEVQETVSYPFLLIHEVLHHIVSLKGLQFFSVDKENLPSLWANLQAAAQKLGLNVDETLAVGMHGDGVPFTKRDSIEILSWNFLAHPTADRIPFTAVSKKHLCKCGCKGTHTWQAIFQVMFWSLKMLFVGVVSSFLPDGTLWDLATQQTRSLRSGAKLCCHALLLQCRGDWPFLRTLFYFPAWNSERICWRCKATQTGPCSYKHTGQQAEWRSNRLTHKMFLATLRLAEVLLNPLLQLPAFTLSCVVLDWLHVVDLGVGADVLGNLFWEIMSHNNLIAGNTKATRLSALWVKLQAWYVRVKPVCKLDNLTEEMIKGKKKPKLRAKGAECRYLIPFGAELSAELAAVANNVHQTAVAALFDNLHFLQRQVSGEFHPFDPNLASVTCRKFCVLYASLEQESIAKGNLLLWSLKPKVHLLQELIEYQVFEHGNPRSFWCYRDESWCGFWARASRRRGGANNAETTATRFLNRYRALEDDSFI